MKCGKLYSLDKVKIKMDEAAKYCNMPTLRGSESINFDTFRKFMLSFIEE